MNYFFIKKTTLGKQHTLCFHLTAAIALAAALTSAAARPSCMSTRYSPKNIYEHISENEQVCNVLEMPGVGRVFTTKNA